MFEFLFRYPRAVFAKGEIVLSGGWPLWLLLLLILAGAVGLGLLMRSKQSDALGSIKGWRSVVLWALQSSMLAGALTLLWQPALLVSTLKPQQNVVSVLVDDSQSMAIKEDGVSRLDQVRKPFNGGVLTALSKRFQTRLYKLTDKAERIKTIDTLSAQAPATNLGESLKQVANETAGLPLGAVILVSDGADNSGGIDLDTITDLRSRRVPIHTVGVGREQPAKDLELSDVQAPARALADSRIAAQLTFQQRGYEGRKAKIAVREGAKVVAMREVTLGKDGNRQTETMLFNAGGAAARAFQFSVDVLEGEENLKNNATQRLVNVQDGRPRILYIEGEPRWEFKFIRRAVEDDKTVKLVTLLRTTQNKFYRQGVDKEKDLEDGFPAKVEELFGYQGIIIGSVELNYFTTTQQELIKQFVDRRGGGLLMLAGRNALSEGGWAKAQLSEILPVTLPERKGTFVRDPATVQLTGTGIDSLITRLVEQPGQNDERWRKLPYLADYQDIGIPKLGSAVLAEYTPGGRARLPLLVTQNYGRGRTAVMATSGTWRWQMQQPLEDQTHEIFWQQLLRWMVAETPGQVVASTPKQMLFDESRARLTADVRDKTYLPAADAQVEARVMGPQGMTELISMKPDSVTPGLYHADFTAPKAGSYLTEFVARRGPTEEIGRDVITFQRQDGVAENFRTSQNRELLEKLSQQTGGKYWKPEDLGKLTDEIALSEAGITVREARDLWDLPAVFMALLALRGAEWWLRRKWGVV